MKSVFGYLIAIIVAVAICAGLFRIVAPYNEETRALVYEQSRTFIQGSKIELDSLCSKRKNEADAMVRAALADTIRLRASRIDSRDMPSHIQRCLEEVR